MVFPLLFSFLKWVYSFFLNVREGNIENVPYPKQRESFEIGLPNS